MNKTFIALVAVGLFLAACQSTDPVADFQDRGITPLEGAVVAEMLAGNTLTIDGAQQGGNWTWAGYYEPDGSARARILGQSELRTGSWRIAEDGAYCSEWSNRSGEQCFAAYQDGEVLTMVNLATNEALVVGIENGNPYSL